MPGESLTGFTVTTKFVLVLYCPSLTVTVIVAMPYWFAVGVIVTVRLLLLPAKTILLIGTKAGLDDSLFRSRLSSVSSPNVNAMAPVDVSSSMF